MALRAPEMLGELCKQLFNMPHNGKDDCSDVRQLI